MEEQCLYKMKKFQKIIWVDPNSMIVLELEALKGIFGHSKIKHFTQIQQARQFIKADPHSRFIVMSSAKLFSSKGRDLNLFEEFTNVYPKCIIFCGNKSKYSFDALTEYIEQVVDDTYEVKNVIERIEIQLQKQSNFKVSSKLYFISDQNSQSEMQTLIQKQLKKLYWEGIQVNSLNLSDFLETVQVFNPNQVRCCAFSIKNAIGINQIENALGNCQVIEAWYEITDKEEDEADFDDNYALACINIKKLKEKIQEEIVKQPMKY